VTAPDVEAFEAADVGFVPAPAPASAVAAGAEVHGVPLAVAVVIIKVVAAASAAGAGANDVVVVSAVGETSATVDDVVAADLEGARMGTDVLELVL